MTATQARGAIGASLLGEPHHDGSEAYVFERPGEVGGTASVRLRVPKPTRVEAVVLRSVVDGEIRPVVAEVDEETAADTWWRADFEVGNPVVPYRWLLSGGDVGYAWLTGSGLVDHDVPDADDFRMTTGALGPDWHLGSVVYQVFPDRFATTGAAPAPPPWARPKEWGERPTGRGFGNQYDFYGGDLPGVEQHLDHVERLGANAIYLTPIFPAGTSHRYDSATFDQIDPLLGGDQALRSLAGAAHARGLRLIGDLTLNHSGNGHEWFTRAREDTGAPERSFYLWDESLPHGYASWYGLPHLPKLNWASAELTDRVLGVVARWLAEGLDGWRIDVANMTGRFRGVDLTHAVARAVRDAAVAAEPEAVVVAEHAHDFRADLRGDGWHGVMNYAGFSRPVWSWLRGDVVPEQLRTSYWGYPVGLVRRSGEQTVATMRAFRAGIPWDGVLHSWVLLDSHDTARFSSVAGGRGRQLVGIGLQMTTPGVPMIFAGDEIGVGGDWGEDARRPMPWASPATWDTALFDAYRRLIALRRASEALKRGGIRYAHVSADAIAYLREAPGERLLCLATRASGPPISLALGADLEPVEGAEAGRDGDFAVLPGDGPAFSVWRLV